jgi:hypothetical protein
MMASMMCRSVAKGGKGMMRSAVAGRKYSVSE